ncbi:hypothetical protein ACLB2K_032037 [Fragaria x ananassa]
MENGVDWRIGEKFSGLTSPDLVRSTGTDDSDLSQVMKAVEAAEVTIKQQVEENIRLRSELEYKTLELHRRQQLLESSSPMPPRSSCLDPVGSHDELLRAPNSETSSQPEGEYDHLPRVDSGEEGLMQLNHSGEDKSVVEEIYENEREIMQLRRQLADYSIKEAKIRKEKYVLETRIANMRLVFDQQQHDLADAASKAMVYRQDILEENIRLAYALQDVQQERSTFGHDAQSIASNVKILFRHLQEKLIMTESRLKQFQYQVRPLQSNSNQSSISNTQQSPPSHSIAAALEISNKDRLEMVTQPPSSHEKAPASPPPAAPQTQTTTMNWDQSTGPGSSSGGVETGNMKHSEPENRNSVAPVVPAKPTIARLDANRYRDDTPLGKQVKFREPEMQTNIDYDDHEEEYNESGGTSPYYPSPSYSRFLSPVHEDLFLEDDLLPAIEGLQISGEALPGHELQASGYSINGTTSCNFEWVRHLPDGSVNYIEGAKQPNYLLTADDVDTCLAIEVQPLDDRKRKGELVKVTRRSLVTPKCKARYRRFFKRVMDHLRCLSSQGFLTYGNLLLWPLRGDLTALSAALNLVWWRLRSFRPTHLFRFLMVALQNS